MYIVMNNIPVVLMVSTLVTGSQCSATTVTEAESSIPHPSSTTTAIESGSSNNDSVPPVDEEPDVSQLDFTMDQFTRPQPVGAIAGMPPNRLKAAGQAVLLTTRTTTSKY